jgi:hypothetical protein
MEVSFMRKGTEQETNKVEEIPNENECPTIEYIKDSDREVNKIIDHLVHIIQ